MQIWTGGLFSCRGEEGEMREERGSTRSYIITIVDGIIDGMFSSVYP